MKLSTGLRALALSVCAIGAISALAQKKTIIVQPETAKIFVNGSEVGTGAYTLKFNRNTDFFMLRFEAPGYLDRSVKLFKDNPNKTISYSLVVDEAEKNSVGGDTEAGEMANKWFDVTCRDGLTEDIVWKRLMNIAVNNFEQIEVRDKDAGWIRTQWISTKFPEQVVRTRLEVRMSFMGDGKLTYRVRLESQIKDRDCGGNNCFVKYDRVLKKYVDVIQQLTTTVGSNL
ncbi:MAG: hypothetical protein K2N10_00155 [Muribaculaceae bacterium]|nr:hypothetical protein [Muribaculaceae bacterium]